MKTHDSNLQLAEANRKLAQSNLKVCPLCDSLNSVENTQCCVCTWHGWFIHDPREIERGLRHLLRRCPEFRAKMPALPREEYSSRVPRWRFLLRRVLKGPIDYKV